MKSFMFDYRSTSGRRPGHAKISREIYPMSIEFFQRVAQSCVTLKCRRSGTKASSPPNSNLEEKGQAMANEANMEKVMTDLKVLTRDAEALMLATAGQAGEKMSEKMSDLRQRLSSALESAKATCHRWEEKAVAGAKVADKTIREHPYESIGLAFGVGLLIGVLVGRR
jgi:ElaB/YqjD/DUF883 family membrane-anchored ribosome-binding protein